MMLYDDSNDEQFSDVTRRLTRWDPIDEDKFYTEVQLLTSARYPIVKKYCEGVTNALKESY